MSGLTGRLGEEQEYSRTQTNSTQGGKDTFSRPRKNSKVMVKEAVSRPRTDGKPGVRETVSRPRADRKGSARDAMSSNLKITSGKNPQLSSKLAAPDDVDDKHLYTRTEANIVPKGGCHTYIYTYVSCALV